MRAAADGIVAIVIAEVVSLSTLPTIVSGLAFVVANVIEAKVVYERKNGSSTSSCNSVADMEGVIAFVPAATTNTAIKSASTCTTTTTTTNLTALILLQLHYSTDLTF